MFASTILLTSCGSDPNTDDSTEQCESYGGKEVDCKDLENTKKLDEMSREFVRGTIGIVYADAIKTNEENIEKMKSFTSSMENAIKADPAEKEEMYVKDIK
ncbi:MAG: hypothetical protein HRT57_07650 [Crocinitomicaceae bacterium]|nr:hypothetical protein [Crocinitomicaceae bacterium]